MGRIWRYIGASVKLINDIDIILEKNGYNDDFLFTNFEAVYKETLNYYHTMNVYPFGHVPYTDDTRMSLLVFQTLYEINKNWIKNYFTGIKQEDVLIAIAHAFKKDFKDIINGWAAHYRLPGISTINAINLLPDNPKNIHTILLSKLTFETSENDKIGGDCGSVIHAAPFRFLENGRRTFDDYAQSPNRNRILCFNCIRH